MTEDRTDELFSHPETHHSHAQPGSPDGQRTYPNLFREPQQPAPRSTGTTD
jgi:hypothetical protein